MVYSDRRHAQNAADAGSLAGAGSAALIIENNYIDYNNFVCNNLSAVMTAATNTAQNRAISNGYPDADIAVTINCIDSGAGPHPEKYLDITTTISKTTQTTLIHVVYDADIDQALQATTRVRPRHSLVFGNAIVALNDSGCSGQSNGQGFHGNAGVEVIGGGIFSNGCLRGDGGVSVDVTGGGISYYDTTGIDPDDFDPLPTQLFDTSQRIPPEAYRVPTPDCGHPNANNVAGSAIEGTHSHQVYTVFPEISRLMTQAIPFSGDGVTLYMLDGEFVVNGGVVDISAPPEAPDPSPAIPGMLILFAPGNSNKILLMVIQDRSSKAPS